MIGKRIQKFLSSQWFKMYNRENDEEVAKEQTIKI